MIINILIFGRTFVPRIGQQNGTETDQDDVETSAMPAK